MVLAGSAFAEPDGLFDPLVPTLRSVPRAAFTRLDPVARLHARGLEPLLHRRPPSVNDQVPQANNIRARLYPGFRYRTRLRDKQADFRRTLARLTVAETVALVWSMEELPPGEFAARYVNKIRTPRLMMPQQPLQARRHSERQFRTWALGQIAVRLLSSAGRSRAHAVDALLRGLRSSDHTLARRCAVVLGGIPDPRATRALQDTPSRARDPELLGAAVFARLRHDAPEALVRAWARHSRPAVRFAVARVCRTLPGGWVDRLVEERTARAVGRDRDDWEAVRSVRRFRKKQTDGDVSFFGLRTHSRRVLYLLDVSGSMIFPMDGKGGKREKRIDRTRRALMQSLMDLPADVTFNVALFASGVRAWERGLKPADAGNREAALDFLEDRAVVGGTNVYAALEFALRSGADTVFLLTDGEPSVGVIVDPALLLAETEERTRYGRLVIHTVGLAQDQNAELLTNLAHLTGGRYVAVR